MKSISIYALTREQKLTNLTKLEYHLSERERPLKFRTWELNSMKALVDQLEAHMEHVYRLRFFYSFQIEQSSHFAFLDFCGDVAAFSLSRSDLSGDGKV